MQRMRAVLDDARQLSSRFRHDAIKIADGRWGSIVACSHCFNDVGLKLACEEIGRIFSGKCGNCKSLDGKGVTNRLLHDVAHRFYVSGTFFHGIGGFAPYLKTTVDDHFGPVSLRPETQQDADLITKLIGLKPRDYGPPLWRLGITSHLGPHAEEPDAPEHVLSRSMAKQVLEGCQAQVLSAGEVVFRIRTGLEGARECVPDQFDAPPAQLNRENGRFDDSTRSIFYAGTSIDVCLQEAKMTTRELITLATCRATRDVKLLDLTGAGAAKIDPTPFGDPEVLFDGLVFSTHRYDECRMLAGIVASMGYDGFVYKSYYSPVMTETGRNVALFGWPLRSGLLEVVGINNVFLEQIRSNYAIGPVCPPSAMEPI